MSEFPRDEIIQFLRKGLRLFKKTLAAVDPDHESSSSSSSEAVIVQSDKKKKKKKKKARRVTKAELQGKRSGAWLPDEDQALSEAIEAHGINYDYLCAAVTTRTRMQIYHHIDFLKKKGVISNQTNQGPPPDHVPGEEDMDSDGESMSDEGHHGDEGDGRPLDLLGAEAPVPLLMPSSTSHIVTMPSTLDAPPRLDDDGGGAGGDKHKRKKKHKSSKRHHDSEGGSAESGGRKRKRRTDSDDGSDRRSHKRR